MSKNFKTIIKYSINVYRLEGGILVFNILLNSTSPSSLPPK